MTEEKENIKTEDKKEKTSTSVISAQAGIQENKEEKIEKPPKENVKADGAKTEKIEKPKEEVGVEKVETKKTKTKEEKKPKPKDFSFLKPGMTVRVHQKIKEAGKKKGEIKERIQVFEGMILSIRGAGVSKTITVRKVSNGVGVEKIFPLHLPTIEEIEPIKQAKVCRAKVYYLRDHKKKLKERRITK